MIRDTGLVGYVILVWWVQSLKSSLRDRELTRILVHSPADDRNHKENTLRVTWFLRMILFF
jgi:hypothetical protein